ncbi:MAG: BsuPI-related putative proteinase inhibitor [Halanaerobiaceae bacterium]
MKKQIIIMVFLLILLIGTLNASAIVFEIDDNEPVGSFKANIPNSINVENNDYIPIDQVASTMETELKWSIEGNKIKGSFGDFSFSSDRFVIANGHLYLPINILVNNFEIYIEIEGNNYYIYNNSKSNPDIEFVINTNKTTYNRQEEMAVSLLLINTSNKEVNLRHSSSQKYDIVIKRYNKEIWRLSDNKGYLQAINNQQLSPDEYILNTELINPGQEKNFYYGTYHIYAEITTRNGGTIKSNEIELKIR